MFERKSLERSRSTVRLSRSPRLNFPLRGALGVTLSLVLWAIVLRHASTAQSVDTRSLDSYASAVKQSVITARIHGMEEFLHLAANSSLKTDGLEFLIWDYLRIGNRVQSVNHAQELLKLDPGNPLAIAARAEANVDAQEPAADRFARLKVALEGLESFHRPEAMTDSEFRLLKNQVGTTLKGAAGLTSLELRDYSSARNYLRQAVAAAPENGRFAYGLALALLLDKNPDASTGYWYLARAVNLTRGTPSGDQISAFARERYQQDGGNDADWKRFLAATTGRNRAPLSNSASPTLNASATGRDPTKKKSSMQLAKNEATRPINARPTSAALYKSNPSASIGTSTQSAQRPVRQGAAVSLGILIQTGLLTGQNRSEILKTLRDIARNLRSDDEAFIMAFSNQLDFEQDLTANSDLLEEALSTLKPASGAALFDGIAFAAGHLKRIGRNENRTLLVISDGHDTTRHEDSTPLSAHLQNVRIDCIGLEVAGGTERDMLEHLASYSGGKAAFASTPSQFRAAAVQIADTMGINFQD
jgi:tetratricopeptide (TPR) repeat protein